MNFIYNYSSPQFSPAFSEPPSPWVTVNESTDLDAPPAAVPSTYNQRSSEKMKADEGLGSGATISAVLYANMNHPEWKTDYPIWNDRYKQIIKKWRTLSTEQKAPYLQQARDNRSALRMKKQQQVIFTFYIFCLSDELEQDINTLNSFLRDLKYVLTILCFNFHFDYVKFTEVY